MFSTIISALIGAIVAMLGTLISFEYRQHRLKKLEMYESTMRNFGKLKTKVVKLRQRQIEDELKFNNTSATTELKEIIEASEQIIIDLTTAKLYISTKSESIIEIANNNILTHAYGARAHLSLPHATENAYEIIIDAVNRIDIEITSFETEIEKSMHSDLSLIPKTKDTTKKVLP
ncbi:hypothetical protein [Salinicola sp. CPA57]|uniref:hypothetical protein n=1 Tax=Salinicola sp. CPA57 TaxID=1949080 RepID=UPI000DA18808|nr:hypothetical protein [Salinicola sp. CPA57]